MTAYAANHLAFQRIAAAGRSFIFPVFPHTSLCFLEQCLWHDGFVPVRNDDPVIAGDFDCVGAAHNVPAPFAEHCLTNIPLISQEFCNQTGCPKIFFLDTAPRCSCAARLDFVILWRAYAVAVQSRRDLPGFRTIRRHLKNAPYHIGGFGIYQKMIFIFWVFDVSIRRIRAEKCPALGPSLLCAFDSAGEIAAVEVVDQRPKRGIQTIDVKRIAAVKAVVDGNEAHAEERKHAGDVVSHSEVITAKAGKIFDQDAVDLPMPDLLQKRLYRWPLEVRATPAVVAKFQDFGIGQFRVTGHIFPKEAALIGYALRFVLFAGFQVHVFTGYAKIDRRSHASAFLPSKYVQSSLYSSR